MLDFINLDIPSIAAAAAILALMLFLMVTSNKITKLRRTVDGVWEELDAQLQHRLELIPYMIELIEKLVTREVSTLDSLTAAHDAAKEACTPEEKIAVENTLIDTVKNLFVVVESRSELKKNQDVILLKTELANTEDKISDLRQSFNDKVVNYNTAIQAFPAALVVGILGFRRCPSFDTQTETTPTP